MGRFFLTPEESAFYQANTGIPDDDSLKAHIVEVAEKALKVYPYHCIATFGFLRFRILRSKPGYQQLLRLGSTRPNALFLDLGCCFGNDIRKAIQDGFPAQNIIASDLQPDFWKYGHELFNTSPSMFPVTFIPGNVLDPSFISIQPPLQELSLETAAPISLQSLIQASPTSLDSLRGHLSAIHTSAFFHLFDTNEQTDIAKKLASLLSPLPGSVIFGSHLGSEQPQEGAKNGTGTLFYRHSPESWKKMWEEVFDGKGAIRVETGFGGGPENEEAAMWWSVLRV